MVPLLGWRMCKSRIMSYRNSLVFGSNVPSSFILSFILKRRRRSTANNKRENVKNIEIEDSRRSS